jgi:hypothetical protein
MRRLTIFLTCAALPCVAATARFEHEGERGAVITGRLLNEAGEPLTGVAVIAAGPDRVMGKDRLTAPGGSAESDVKGRYRISGLLPDDYYVFACPPPFWSVRPPDGRRSRRRQRRSLCIGGHRSDPRHA